MNIQDRMPKDKTDYDIGYDYGYDNGYKDGVNVSEKQIAELLTEIECLNNRLHNNKIRVQEALSR